MELNSKQKLQILQQIYVLELLADLLKLNQLHLAVRQLFDLFRDVASVAVCLH